MNKLKNDVEKVRKRRKEKKVQELKFKEKKFYFVIFIKMRKGIAKCVLGGYRAPKVKACLLR